MCVWILYMRILHSDTLLWPLVTKCHAWYNPSHPVERDVIIEWPRGKGTETGRERPPNANSWIQSCSASSIQHPSVDSCVYVAAPGSQIDWICCTFSEWLVAARNNWSIGPMLTFEGGFSTEKKTWQPWHSSGHRSQMEGIGIGKGCDGEKCSSSKSRRRGKCHTHSCSHEFGGGEEVQYGKEGQRTTGTNADG